MFIKFTKFYLTKKDAIMSATELTLEEQISAEIAGIEEKILADSPLLPQALAKVHHEVSRNPQLINTLTPEEIGIIVKGLSKYTDTKIVATKKKPTKKALSKVTVDDL